MIDVHDLRSEIRWLASGFLLMLCSGFGQTFFIALFAGHLKADLAMTDGQFGTIYTAGTLASAALLMWAGKFADQLTIRWLGAGVLAGLAAISLTMASVSSVWTLMLAIFGLRFFGQGMLTHTAMTAMGRWFNRKRGRAVSIAALGMPTGEAVLPILTVAVIGLIGWRQTWAVTALIIMILPLPVLFALLKHERRPQTGPNPAGALEEEPGRRQWSRGEVLKAPLFYALIPGVVALPFVSTGIFINQVTIVNIKGWELAWFAANFPVFAACNVTAALTSGWLVDRFDARRLLPLYLLPLGVAIVLLTYIDSPTAIPAFMALAGFSHGAGNAVQGSLWPELFGTRHLGAIRGTVMSAVVFSTALSPAMIGILMDAGVAFETLLLGMACCCFLATLLMALLVPRLNRLAAA